MLSGHIGSAVRELKIRLDAAFGPAVEVYVFGSSARGDRAPMSDVDVLVLLPIEPDNSMEERVFDIAFEIELAADIVFGVIVYSKAFWGSALSRETPLYRNISKEGVAV